MPNFQQLEIYSLVLHHVPHGIVLAKETWNVELSSSEKRQFPA